MKLGEALVKEGLITREQLDQALKRQVQAWGRVGTNIVELRFLEEEELSQFISRFFKLPAVSFEMLDSIPEDVINSINKEIVERYKLLPFKKERNRLHTAMLNPKNIKEIDELCFKTGYTIIPYVITEMRMLYALEKYYGIKHSSRYTSLKNRFDPDTKIEETSINKIKIAFAEVMETEDVAEILMKESYKIAKRVALFEVKDGKIKGWKSIGLDIDKFEIIGRGSPIFTEVLEKGSYYRGPILNIEGNEPLIKILSGTPRDVLVLPINIRDKIVALLYADNGNRSVLDANVGFLSVLASMATIAFEIPNLRKKILDFSFSIL